MVGFIDELYVGVFDVVVDYFDEVFGVVWVNVGVVWYVVDMCGDFFE